MSTNSKKPQLLIPARYYVRLSEMLSREKIDLAELFRELRLPLRALVEPDAMLRLQQVERLIEVLHQRTRRSDLGFELGKQLSVSAHSFVGFGMLNSPTVDQAFHFLSRYFGLVMPSFRLRYLTGPDFGEMHFMPTTSMSHECLVFHLEAIGMAALRELHDLSNGRRFNTQLSLSIAPPPHAARYRDIADLATRFHVEPTPGVRLRIHADLRAIPLTAADPNALRVSEERCRQLIQKVTTVRRLGDLITMTLSETGEGLATQGEIAALFNISTRTLNRYLQLENTSFRDIARQVQHTLAQQRLRSGGMTVTEVAYSLGFSDAANFTRAFRTIERCSPSEYQQGAGRQRTSR
ncbi:MAG: AraC family transcriptional regulator ligand-binding domain-containing protein [Pseudomonadota bacterium]